MLPYLININNEEGIFDISDDIKFIGMYPLVTPTSIWHNGATYVVGYKTDVSNNDPVILRWEDEVIDFITVGDTTKPDPYGLEHQFPALLVIDGYIYVFQVNGHGAEIQIWKSNFPENIKDGFTLFHTINGSFGYCNPRLLPDGRIVILSRDTPTGFGQMIALSNPNDFTVWQTKKITEPDYNTHHHRHYISAPYYYGSNSWNYFGVSFRNDDATPETYFAQAIYKTQDFITFYNLDETFSKNIDVNGKITHAELEANCMIVGSIDNDTDFAGGINFIVKDDVVYSSYYDATDSNWYFTKITGVVRTNTLIDISDLRFPNLNSVNNIFILYNGSNLVLFLFEDKSGVQERNIYTCDLDFQNLQFKTQVWKDGENTGARQSMIPFNLNEISGEYIIGGSDTNSGEFLYQINNDKFLI
jgi:hypothetical protein